MGLPAGHHFSHQAPGANGHAHAQHIVARGKAQVLDVGRRPDQRQVIRRHGAVPMPFLRLTLAQGFDQVVPGAFDQRQKSFRIG